MTKTPEQYFDNPYPPQDYKPVRTIATPLPPIPQRLIQRRLEQEPLELDDSAHPGSVNRNNELDQGE